jgi:4a-hydroxytetrahydrobiopterin dehydratase
MSAVKLDAIAIQASLDALNAGAATPWTLEGGKLHRAFQFADFVAAFRFMTGVALVAESMNHHPEWFNVYNRVVVDLRTHDADGITELDFALARRMESLAG